MNSSITHKQVRRQLAAMACEYFDVGILRQDGRMLLLEAWTARQIEQEIQPLRRENARGAHIFVRPHGAHALSLIDDLGIDAIARMTDAGFQPALVVETSPQNFQAWLKHERTLDHNMSTLAAKKLAKRFGGDLSSADWRHFGRLAGFTNRKPERLMPSGLAPFVCLRQCKGKTYDAARVFLEHVKSLADKAAAERANWTACRPTSDGNPVQSLPEFHRSVRYAGDLHRTDMAWALHAASHGLSEKQIRDEILHCRDLSKKGRLQRQLNYAERTANKARRTVDSIR
jgi:hypothetical protein